MLGKLAGTGHIHHNAGELSRFVKGEHQVQKRIRTGFIVAEQFIIGIAIHNGFAAGCHKAAFAVFQLLIEIHHAAGMGHDGVAIAVANAAFGTVIPCLADCRRCHLKEEFPGLLAGKDCSTIRCFFRRFVFDDNGHLDNSVVGRRLQYQPICILSFVITPDYGGLCCFKRRFPDSACKAVWKKA